MTNKTVITLNGASEPCASCGVPKLYAHKDSCTGGNHMTPDCMTNHQHQSLIETLYRDQKAKVIVDHINHREIVRDGMRYFFGYDSKVTQEWPEPGWMFYRLEKET